jgi:hypothetical protein
MPSSRPSTVGSTVCRLKPGRHRPPIQGRLRPCHSHRPTQTEARPGRTGNAADVPVAPRSTTRLRRAHATAAITGEPVRGLLLTARGDDRVAVAGSSELHTDLPAASCMLVPLPLTKWWPVDQRAADAKSRGWEGAPRPSATSSRACSSGACTSCIRPSRATTCWPASPNCCRG